MQSNSARRGHSVHSHCIPPCEHGSEKDPGGQDLAWGAPGILTEQTSTRKSLPKALPQASRLQVTLESL